MYVFNVVFNKYNFNLTLKQVIIKEYDDSRTDKKSLCHFH